MISKILILASYSIFCLFINSPYKSNPADTSYNAKSYLFLAIELYNNP